jgi:integrase
MATKLIISKECELRPIEIFNLKVKDIDLEQKILYPTTAKHGAPRKLKISQRLKQALEEHITKNNLNNEDKLFKGNATYYGKSFRYTRNKLAEKLHDQTIKTIRLYDFRHYYGTTTYKKTNLLYIMQQMGHKRVETTMIYMHLADIPQDEEWICNTATTKEEIIKLVENGFEHITDKDGISYFKNANNPSLFLQLHPSSFFSRFDSVS